MTPRPPQRRRTIDARLGLTRTGEQSGQGRVVAVPRVVGVLIGLMTVVFVATWLAPDRLAMRIDYLLGFRPDRLFASGPYGGGPLSGALPLVTHVFAHGNWPHLVMNSLWMFVFGTGVARRLQVERSSGAVRAWNTAVFLAFFFACAAAGALFYAAFHLGSGTLLIGASGAISGLMAGAIRFALRPFAPYGPAHGRLARVTARPILAVTVFYVGFNLLTPLGLGRLFGAGLDIAWEAHVGGYLFGLLSFPVFDGLVRRRAEVVAR